MKKLILFCLLSIFFLHGSAFSAFNFIDNGDGTVTDARTGLVWLKDANPCGTKKWYDAETYCANLASGTAGLTDGSVAGDWRLPTLYELEGIGTDPPDTWESGYPLPVTWTMPGASFTNVQSNVYWSGTSYAGNTDYAWHVYMGLGYVGNSSKSYRYPLYVWPVRGYVKITTTTITSSTTTTAQTTAIELSRFTATPKAGTVILQWSTESEIDNAGFNIYRAESEDGEYIKINDTVIPSQGSSTQGASYEITDKDVQNRKTYFYKLEDIDLNGRATMHGAVSATPRLIFRFRD